MTAVRERGTCSELPKRKRFQLGQRVRYMGSPMLGPPSLSVGTVALVAGPRGQSIHPDPGRLMTFVNWDGRTGEGVYTTMLTEAMRCSRCHHWLHPDGNGTCGQIKNGQLCNGLIEAVP